MFRPMKVCGCVGWRKERVGRCGMERRQWVGLGYESNQPQPPVKVQLDGYLARSNRLL